MSEHSPAGPHALQRLFLCGGSYLLAKDLPEPPPGDYAKEGNCAHEGLSAGIRHDSWDALLACGDGFADIPDLWRSVKALWPDAIVLSEHKMDLTHVHPLIGHGTLDAALVLPFDSGVVIDLKSLFGWHPRADENLQLTAYALGLAKEYGLDSVEVHLWQPQVERFSSARFERSDLERSTEFLRRIVDRCRKPLASQEFVAGNHCQYCRAILKCPAMARARDMFKESAAGMDAPVADPETVAAWLAEVEAMDTFSGAVRARAYQLLTSGCAVRGWQLREGRGSREWTCKPDAVEKLLCDQGHELGDAWNHELKSPAQIEKLVGKSKEAAEAMSTLWAKKPGEMKLSRATEKEGGE